MEILNGKIYNMLLYKTETHYYYFNSDGIYSVIRAESIHNLPEEINRSLYNSRDQLIDFSRVPYIKEGFKSKYNPSELLSFIRRLVIGDTVEYFDGMLGHYVKSKAVDTTRIDINRTVKIDPETIKNIIIRKANSTVFYFNKNGIYVCESFKKKEKMLRKDNNVADILGIGDFKNTWKLKKLLTLIPDGATIEYLEHMIASDDAALYVNTHNPCTYEVKYFITEVCKPQIKRSYGNTNKKTFDYIEINMGVACMDMEYIKNNIRSIVNIAIRRIAKDPEYKKYGVEVNYLRVTGCYSLEGQRLYTKLINGIKLIFELKNI